MLDTLSRALNTFFDDKRVTITVVYVWFVIVLVLFAWLGIFSTSYMQVGPNDDLVYMGMPLNTWPRWGTVILFVLVSTSINDIAGDAISPWMQNCICDHKNRYIPYSKTTCIAISQLWALYCAVMSIASIALVFSQFDILFVRIVVDISVNQYTTTRFLRNKTHNTARYDAWFEQHPGDDIAGDAELHEPSAGDAGLHEPGAGVESDTEQQGVPPPAHGVGKKKRKAGTVAHAAIEKTGLLQEV